MTVVLPIAAASFIFALGVMVGNGYTTREQDQRDRRQAAIQRGLSLWQRDLHEMAERQAAKEEALRWRYLEQAGMTLIDHDKHKKVATQDHASRQAWRPTWW